MALTMEQILALGLEGPSVQTAQLDPSILAALQQLQAQYFPEGGIWGTGGQEGSETDAGMTRSGEVGVPLGIGGYEVNYGPGTRYQEGGGVGDSENGQSVYSGWDGGSVSVPAGGRWFDQYSPNTGDWTGRSLDSSGFVDVRDSLGKLALMAVASYYGAGALAGEGAAGAGAAGAGAGAEAGAGAGAVAGGAGAAGGTVSLTAADIAAANAAATAGLSGQVAATAPGALGAGGAAGAAGAAGAYTTAAADSQAANAALGLSANAGSVPATVNLVNAGGTMATGAGAGSSIADWVTRAASDPSNWARLAGAAAGAASSGDQTQSSTQNREPWGPAQDWIKQNIGIGQGLQQQYLQHPFSATQQQAHNNQFGLLNAANQSMPAWMQGMQANASGANNYDRNNPRRGLLGAGQATLPQLGLLAPTYQFGG